MTNLVGAGCDPTEIQALSCDASIVDEGDLLPRPTGGSRVFEGSLELRVPLSSNFQAAAFGDFGQLWQDQLENKGLEVTPGLGVRYLSPIGPLRLDVAYRFRGGEALPVVTPQLVDYDPAIHDPDDRIQVGGERLPYVEGDQLAILEPRVLYGADPSFWQRLQIHFSIGQAF